MPEIPSWKEHEQPVRAHCLHYISEKEFLQSYRGKAKMYCCICGQERATQTRPVPPLGHGRFHREQNSVPVSWDDECPGGGE